jgi:anti-sigma B factor antagonist
MEAPRSGSPIVTALEQRERRTMDLQFDTEVKGQWALLSVSGEVDLYTAPQLRERIVELIDEGNHRILVSLEKVGFMDSTGLGVLVSGLKRVKEHEGEFALVSTPPQILRLLKITGLDQVFPLYATVEEAVRA